MRECDYYPDGAYNDPNAPWNQPEPESVELDVVVSQSLSKSTTLTVDDYTATSWCDSEPDDEGGYVTTGGVDYDFSDCNLEKAFIDQDYSPLELINKFKELLEWHKDNESPLSKYTIRNLIRACEGWTEDEFSIEQE